MKIEFSTTFKMISLSTIGLILMSIGLTMFITNAASVIQQEYHKPDTTIVIRNGVADTTITIKR